MALVVSIGLLGIDLSTYDAWPQRFLIYKTGVKMASNVRDSDTSLWLHNKLGVSTDSWTGGSICSQLNPEVLKNIQECFVELQTQVKLKFLLSFFQFSRRNLEEVISLFEFSYICCTFFVKFNLIFHTYFLVEDRVGRNTRASIC